MSEAIDRIAARAPGQQIELVGYSGGGAVAVLVAARRHDIASLRTVAGNLDTEMVNRLHNVSAMPQSLNPVDAAHQVAEIPQIHFSGDGDAVVPIDVPRHFVNQSRTHCAQVITVAGMNHTGAWATRWPDLLQVHPVCSK